MSSRAPAHEESSIPQQAAAMALTGVLMFVACLPLVTTLAAGGAAAALLREQATLDRDPRVRRFARLFLLALHDPFGVAVVATAVVVAALDTLAVLGGLPGARLLAPLLAVAVVAAVVCGLRAAARWQPGRRWREVLVEAARATAADPRGSLVLLLALGVMAVIVSQAIAFVVIAPGLLMLTALAVELRRRS